MITRVHIKGYKSLRDAEISFHPLTVISGPNAAGKSNLLDALGLLSRVVTRRSLKEAFEEHRGLPLEAFTIDRSLNDLISHGKAEFEMEVDVELSPSVVKETEELVQKMRESLPQSTPSAPSRRLILEKYLRYGIRLRIMTDSGLLQVVGERLSAINRLGAEKQSRKPFIETKDKDNRIHLRMERQGHPTYHDIGLDHAIASMPLYAPHHPHIAAFKEELSRWRFYYLEPKTMRVESGLKVADTLGPYGSDLAAFYNTLRSREPRQFDALNHTLREVLPAVKGVDVERTTMGLLRLNVLEDGTTYSAGVISEGTLRVLGLLAITNALSPLTVVGYEEPENGVHPRRLKLIAELFKNAAVRGNCQYVINTHSPILPEFFAPENLVLCTREDGSTKFSQYKLGPLFMRPEVERVLAQGEPEETSIAEKLLRGDFGG
ncbi:MAG: AAA family ATPase [Chloroflexi bacterium]|nr:AAA family ATPase [Chloroflexota bacterium]